MMVLVPREKNKTREVRCGNCGEPCEFEKSDPCEGGCGKIFCPVCAGLRSLCDDCFVLFYRDRERTADDARCDPH